MSKHLLLHPFLPGSRSHFVSLTCFPGELQEWPEEEYPPYANGPGYVLSSDIAENIVSDFEKHKLRVHTISPYFSDLVFSYPLLPKPSIFCRAFVYDYVGLLCFLVIVVGLSIRGIFELCIDEKPSGCNHELSWLI